MAYDYSDLVEKTRRWAEQALASGWITQEVAQQLSDADFRSPESLFHNGASQSGSRPLIVAFMGGSGVGKSTLLNRLAGKPIARTGIERPTSREVTLFHHHSVAMQQLPEQLPITQIKIAQHEEDAKKHIIWIDMPDFDSTEQSNKQLVLQWLPHVDVLIYVVSPERYRDEKAWQLLLAEGARHAWLFVLNQWDLGQPEQFDDFQQQLHKAGFFEPIIFKTSCVENLQGDEFGGLEETIISLANEHTVVQLALRSQQIRKHELKQKLQNTQALLGTETAFQQAQNLWQNQWLQTVKALEQGFAWPIQNMASYYAEHASDLTIQSRSNLVNLWDDWAQSRFDDALDEFIINFDQQGIPVMPLKNQLAALREKAPKVIQAQTELSARNALARPGNVVQRGFLKCVRFCEIVLPLVAMGWVGYQVFAGYYDSSTRHMNYLGVDFAIHSSLMIALTWLIPFFILKKAQPSLQKSALSGLSKGLTAALETINNEVSQEVAKIAIEHKEHNLELAEIINQCAATGVESRISVANNNPLARMLID